MRKIILLLLTISTYLFGYIGYFDKPKNTLEWESVIDLKLYDNKYTPQGLAFLGENLLAVSIHKDSEFSMIMVFDISKSKPNLIRSLKLPKDATHTSDLEYFEDKIYALDYNSNKIYIIDKNEVINSDSISSYKEIDTGLKGSGSACIMNINDEPYYVMTQFLRSDKLYFIPLKNIKNKQKIQKEDISFKLSASYFIQGLTCKGDKIIASANANGTDIIYLYQLKNKNLKLLKTFNAPTDMVEDVDLKDGYIFTSGEDKNENIIYKAIIDEI
jgi:hypothetical protein